MLNYLPYPFRDSPRPIAEDEVHIFLVDLDAPDACVAELSRLLSSAERGRAARFRFAADRRAYIVRHAALRQILANLLGQNAEELSFATGRFGKPRLAGKACQSRLQFSISHSGTLCLCAVARGREVGIDIERIRADFDLASLAKTEFSPAESNAILSLPEEERPAAFFRCWTRKEAFLKATGQGLRIPLRSFTVSVGRTAVLIETLFDPTAVSRWSLADISPTCDYAACVAVAHDTFTVFPWRWSTNDP